MKATSIQIQFRDIELLQSLFEARIMTRFHATALHFENMESYAKKRISKLILHGLVGCRKRNVNQKEILFLSEKGFEFLKQNGHLADYPSLSTERVAARANLHPLMTEHELAILDVKVALIMAIKATPHFSIRKFHTMPRLFEFIVPQENSNRPVKPDAYISLLEQTKDGDYAHDLFLELDRSTETQNVLVSKSVAYRQFYRTGGYALQNGGSAADFEKFPFRVLMVLKNTERRNNTAESLLQRKIFSHTWLATFAEVISNPLGAIWVRPQDYREVVKMTAFEHSEFSGQLGYRRKPEREKYVEDNIKKHRLFED